MIAGTLNEIISIYRPHVNEGKYGPKKTVYVPYIKNTRARVDWNNGNRTDVNNEIFYAYVVQFTVRAYHVIDDYMRIKWNGKYYRILNIIPDNHGQEIKIEAELVNE